MVGNIGIALEVAKNAKLREALQELRGAVTGAYGDDQLLPQERSAMWKAAWAVIREFRTNGRS